MEMQKRRERIERWRAERKKKEQEATKKDGKSTILANLQIPSKKWTLEDESDEETPVMQNSNKDTKEEEEGDLKEDMGLVKEEVLVEDVDPLDAFMAEVWFIIPLILILFIIKSKLCWLGTNVNCKKCRWMQIIRSTYNDLSIHTSVKKNTGRKLGGQHFNFAIIFERVEIS